MGQFSWLDCVTGEQIVDSLPRKSYLLVPKEFGGGHIEEPCYGGYGIFGGHDVFDLVADWNQSMIPEIMRKASIGKWTCCIGDGDKQLMGDFFDGKPLKDQYSEGCLPSEKRSIGIIMSCYDDDNARLDFPIKITYDESAVYEDCKPSLSDPNQGWLVEDDSQKEYNNYQLRWMIEHGHSISELIDELDLVKQDWADGSEKVSDIFHAWENTIGFCGEIWDNKFEWDESQEA